MPIDLLERATMVGLDKRKVAKGKDKASHHALQNAEGTLQNRCRILQDQTFQIKMGYLPSHHSTLENPKPTRRQIRVADLHRRS